jgi:hypothetical protein
MTTLLEKERNWLTDQLSHIDYSSDRHKAVLYELGLLRAMLAQLMHSDSNNVAIVKRIIQSNPYYITNKR